MPIFAETQQMCKKCFSTQLASILRNGHGITNNCPRPQHVTLFYCYEIHYYSIFCDFDYNASCVKVHRIITYIDDL